LKLILEIDKKRFELVIVIWDLIFSIIIIANIISYQLISMFISFNCKD